MKTEMYKSIGTLKVLVVVSMHSSCTSTVDSLLSSAVRFPRGKLILVFVRYVTRYLYKHIGHFVSFFFLSFFVKNCFSPLKYYLNKMEPNGLIIKSVFTIHC